MSEFDVIVIGAGAAGIAAARRLRQHGQRVQVLEAGAMPGGRARSDNLTFGTPFDCGAHWFHSPADNPLRALADELAFDYQREPYAARLYRDGALLAATAQAACAAAVESGFARIAALGAGAADAPASAALLADARWSAVMAAEFTAKQGVAPSAGSSRDFARYVWQGEDLPVSGGFGNLLGQLAHGLPVALNSPVTRVEWQHRPYLRVIGPRGSLRARRVIVTVSTGVLASGALRFSPDLPPRTQEAIHALPMGHCNKLALAFTRPLLDETRGSLLVPAGDDAVPLELLLHPAGQPLAVAIVSGEFGRTLAAAGVAAMRDYVLGELVGLFGSRVMVRLAPTHLLVDWDRDPFVRGYVAAPRAGDADARQWLAESPHAGLYFAGEATSLTAMGDAHGAWRSGEAAADAALRDVS